jgi:hypothetical protein
MPSRIADPPRFFYFVTINAFFGKRIFSIYLTAKTVTPDGEIVAHQGLKKEHMDSPVAEIMMGVVDPRFRGRGLFEKMKKISFEYINGGLRSFRGGCNGALLTRKRPIAPSVREKPAYCLALSPKTQNLSPLESWIRGNRLSCCITVFPLNRKGWSICPPITRPSFRKFTITETFVIHISGRRSG